MAAVYLDEEDVWKCRKHPSKRHRSGVCPTCLRDRLCSLCPDCAHVRPCACSALTSCSSSSSSSFSRFSVSGGENFSLAIGTVGRVSNLIESEPAFRRSRSAAVPFLRSKSKAVSKLDFVGNEVKNNGGIGKTTTIVSFWWWLKGGSKSDKENTNINDMEEERRVKMMKSRSVAVATSDFGKPKRGGKWYFPSPIKVFRQSRLAKVVVQERSPIYRG